VFCVGGIIGITAPDRFSTAARTSETWLAGWMDGRVAHRCLFHNSNAGWDKKLAGRIHPGWWQNKLHGLGKETMAGLAEETGLTRVKQVSKGKR